MQLLTTDLSSPGKWEAFVQSHPHATLFHTAAWQRALARSFKYRPCCLQAEQSGRVVGVLPLWGVTSLPLGRHLCSTPMGNYGSVCADSEEATQALLGAASRIARQTRAGYVELRDRSALRRGLPIKTNFATAVLSLAEDPDLVWRKRLQSRTRNHVRKARRAGLEVVKGPEWLGAFHRVFERNMRRLGTPAFGEHYLRAVFAEFGQAATCLCVRHGGRVIGGLVTLAFRDTVYVPWASSLREHFSLSPNNLLYWTAIREACEAGFRWFDFGRSTRGTGPLRFKLQWGAEEQVLHYHYLLPGGGSPPSFEAHSSRGALASAVWQRLPLTVTRVLGHWARAQLAV